MSFVLIAKITGQEAEQHLVTGSWSVIETEVSEIPDSFFPDADITYTGHPRVELTGDSINIEEIKLAVEKLKEIILEKFPDWKGELSYDPKYPYFQ